MVNFAKTFIINILMLWCLLVLVSAVPLISYNFDNTLQNTSSYAYTDGIRSNSVNLQIITKDNGAICKYSQYANISFLDMEGSFDFNFQNINRKAFNGMSDGVYYYYIKCKDNFGNISGELQVSFSISTPVTAKIYLSRNDSYVGPGITKVSLTTSKILSSKPSLSFSLDGSNYESIPLTGSNTDWYGYMHISNDAGETPGSFKFRGIDIDGAVGEDITSGEIFLVDTIKPKGIVDIKVIGQSNSIRFDWHFDEEVSHYNIYRNILPNIDYSDYYSDSDDDYFVDRSVEKGKTYYYKVTAVDKAGNEGPLSFEFSVNSLINDTSSSNQNTNNGLAPELLSSVDGFIADINTLTGSLNGIKERLTNDETQNAIYTSLKLEREIESSKSELSSLINEVDAYKKQSLTKSELDNKLGNAKIKLNIIKKKIPESITILSKDKFDKTANENDIRAVLLNLYSLEGESDKINNILKLSNALSKNAPLAVTTEAYNIDIGYIDGSKKSLSLVNEKINSEINKDYNATILEFIPKDLASSLSDIDIKNTVYESIKEDPIIGFPLDTKQISYSFNKNIDLNLIRQIKTVLIAEEQEEKQINSPTGFFSNFNSNGSGSYIGIGIGIFAIVGLLIYFIFNKNIGGTKKLDEISNFILEAKIYKKNNQGKQLKDTYTKISILYKGLTERDKKEIYPIITDVFNGAKEE